MVCTQCGKDGWARKFGDMEVGIMCDECWDKWVYGHHAALVSRHLNNKYLIEVQHPLIRPGLKITTEASERYVVEIVRKVMDLVREINK